MKEDWDQDELWNLLGKAKPVSVSPFFSRNVLREVRQLTPRPWIPTLVLRWLGAGALAVLATGFFLNLNDSSPSASPARPAEFVEIFDAAAGLDKLVAVEEISFTSFTADL